MRFQNFPPLSFYQFLPSINGNVTCTMALFQPQMFGDCAFAAFQFYILQYYCAAAVLLFVAVVAVVADVAIIFNADHWWRARTGVRGTGLRGATPRRSPPGYRLELSRMSQSKSCTYRFSSSLLKINPCVKHNSHARILLAHLSCHTKN